MYLLGLDIGSSSVKVALVSTATTEMVAMAQSPNTEMEIASPHEGWAEQHPDLWWTHLVAACQDLAALHPEKMKAVQAIGISYQMHGLVLLDENDEILRPAIIWCDSRAVEIGEAAFAEIGQSTCLHHLLNSPGNFTASKLRWVQENEPETYAKVAVAMLPGDFIAFKLTGIVATTASGLSEGILWDYLEQAPAQLVMNQYEIDSGLLPQVLPTFGEQGKVTPQVAQALGLPSGIPVSYRAGDQPNNALSLHVLNPGEVAATGGTSGVVYGVVEEPLFDPESRVNGFLHVNHLPEKPRIGVLLCINGAGIQFSWLRRMTSHQPLSYTDMSLAAEEIPVGSSGISMLPFGNGAERMLGNKALGAHIHNLDFNRHHIGHLYRAALEGIAFSFVYGLEIMKGMGMETTRLKVDSHNLFQSQVFSQTIANLSRCQIDMLDTNGAIGAARGAGFGAGIYQTLDEAVGRQRILKQYHPQDETQPFEVAYQRWKQLLQESIQNPIFSAL